MRRDGTADSRGVWQPYGPPYDAETPVFGPCGGAAAYRRAMLDQVGLFEERFFMYCEDIDLNWRAQLAGWSSVYAPRAVVYHHLSATGGGTLSSYYVGRNTLWVMARCLPASSGGGVGATSYAANCASPSPHCVPGVGPQHGPASEASSRDCSPGPGGSGRAGASNPNAASHRARSCHCSNWNRSLVDSVYLSIVVPCYNESENLKAGVLQEMSDYLARRAFRYEVIIADDGSADDSRELIRGQLPNLPGFSLQENPHGGKPAALWHGIQAAAGEIVLFTDMDQSTPLNQIERLLPLFDAGCDVVIGSRGMERANFPLYRRIGSQLFRGFRRLFILRDISDTQCGFKAMRLAVAQEIFPRLEPIRRQGPVSGWKVTAFDVELLFLAERAGYRLGEVQVSWANRDRSRGKRKSYLAESREMASQVLRVKLNAWRGFYDRPTD